MHVCMYVYIHRDLLLYERVTHHHSRFPNSVYVCTYACAYSEVVSVDLIFLILMYASSVYVYTYACAYSEVVSVDLIFLILTYASNVYVCMYVRKSLYVCMYVSM